MRLVAYSISVSALLFPIAAHAGWFGPSDYHECVVDNMKGQKIYMMSEVKAVCQTRFPCASGQSWYEERCESDDFIKAQLDAYTEATRNSLK